MSDCPCPQVTAARRPRFPASAGMLRRSSSAAVLEVMPHPNADRLVLCRLDDGQQVHTVLTGAPNLFPYKGTGPLDKPLKVAYAREGAQIYDGHQPGQVLVTLKRAKIRGVDSYSMVCSEKELGISDEHEGIILWMMTPSRVRRWWITWAMLFWISPSRPISPGMPTSWAWRAK